MLGCGDDAGGDAGAGLQLELGTGTIEWEPIVGDSLELVAGPQGGHHFVVHARARGLVPGNPDRPGDGNPITEFFVFDEQMTRIDANFGPYALGYRPTGDGWYQLPSARILQVVEAEVPNMYGNRVMIRVTVEDTAGHQGSSERWVAVPPEAGSDAGVTDAGVVDGG